MATGTALDVGQRIKRLRESAHLSQQQLASRAGMAKDTIGYAERGERLPHPSNLLKIAEALGVDVAVLYGKRPKTREAYEDHLRAVASHYGISADEAADALRQAAGRAS